MSAEVLKTVSSVRCSSYYYKFLSFSCISWLPALSKAHWGGWRDDQRATSPYCQALNHPPPSSCLERLASSPRSVLRTFYTQLISWAMPMSHLAAFPEAQKPTLGAKVLVSNCSWMETEEPLAPWTRKTTTEGRTSLEAPMVNSQATQGRTPISMD